MSDLYFDFLPEELMLIIMEYLRFQCDIFKILYPSLYRIRLVILYLYIT